VVEDGLDEAICLVCGEMRPVRAALVEDERALLDRSEADRQTACLEDRLLGC
jgi:hypothetical protein